jgi:hypothetical protein
MKPTVSRHLAICDTDTSYLELMQGYLKRKNPMGFEIITFSTTVNAVTASQSDEIDILLIGEKTFDDNVKNINAKKIFILQEDGLSGIKGYDMVAKYQSAEKLIGTVLEQYALDEKCDSIVKCGKNNTTVIAFYSPEHHAAQSITALATAQLISDKGGKVLYLNLHGFSGFEELMNISYESDITDFMYFVLKHSEKLLYKLEGIKRTVHKVDYLPPALDYKDLAQIKAEDWRRALDLIIYSGDYTHIVVDLSEDCQGFYEILEMSGSIYILSNDNSTFSHAAKAHFKRLLHAKEREDILGKIIELSLPYTVMDGHLQLENLQSSTVGAYMGGIVR